MIPDPLTCLALASVLSPPAPELEAGVPLDDPPCLALRVEGAGRMGAQWPDLLPGTYAELSRARTALGVGQGPVGARVALVAVRSAPEQGYVGIDGEAWVPTVQLAEGRARVDALGLGASMGLVDDLWVATGNRAWGLRAVAPVLAEQQGWLPRSDLGGLAAWTSPGRWLTVAGSVTSGEGASRRDRNDGFDSTGLLTLRPLAAAGPEAPTLALQLMVRDGSWGQAYVRDHRQGARLRAAWGPGVIGAELLAAQGVQGDGSRTPRGWSTWLSAEPEALPLLAFLRVDGLSEDPGDDEARGSSLWTGAGLRLPAGRAERAAGRLLLVYRSEARGPAAAPLAGAAGLTELRQIFVQLDVDVLTTVWGEGP